MVQDADNKGFILVGAKHGLTDGAFDAAILVAAGDRHRPRFVTILSGEAEQRGLERRRGDQSGKHQTPTPIRLVARRNTPEATEEALKDPSGINRSI